jgi:uncharacterized protein GlcG (DUF336 family)
MTHFNILANSSLTKRAVALTAVLLLISLFLLFGSTNAASPVAQPALPQQSVLPLGLALEAASTALTACEADGYRVTVAVVDRSGVEKVVLKGDGAGPHTIASSIGKAFTSASMGRATGDIATAIAENPELDELKAMDERILILAGGLPIEIQGEIVAGIGVGGAPGGNLDAACAQAGVDQITAN